MKTATITWIKWNNFGSLLQAYALQQQILSMGFENAILNDTNENEVYCKFRYTWKSKIKHIIKKTIRLVFKNPKTNSQKTNFQKNQEQVNVLYEKFKREYLKIDYDVKNKKELNKRYDAFICGSDQIWHPGDVKYKTINNAPFYYAGFSDKKKVAYGASFGLRKYPDAFKQQFKNLTDGFSHLSSREPEGCEIIKEITGRQAQLVSDPTLLLTEKQWRKIINTEKKTEKYIFAYFLSNNLWYVDYAKEYSQKIGMPLHIIFNLPQYEKIGGELICAGPTEFLKEIDSATLVLTDSFHGTVFSTLLETEFVVFRRFDEGKDEGQNCRVENITAKMGILERFISKENIKNIDNLPPIDFKKCKSNLQPFIDESKAFLQKALT